MRLGVPLVVILHLAILGYLLASVWSVGRLVRPGAFRPGWASRFLVLAVVLLLPLVVSAPLIGGGEVFADLFYTLMLLLWGVGAVTVLLAWRYRTEALVAFVSPLFLTLSLGGAFTAIPRAEGSPDLAGGMSFLHGIFIFGAYACFAASCAAGAMYLLQEASLRGAAYPRLLWRLPSLEATDRIGIVSASTGVLLLSAAIATGMLWQQREGTLGERWYLDLTVICGAITWLLYACAAGLRLTSVARGRRIAAAYVGAFVIVLVTFLGTSFIFRTGHGAIRFVEVKDHHNITLQGDRP